MTLSLPRCFAHRGGGSLAPENTLAGIRLAASLGFQAVEFDVMLSQDGTPVLIHDETLERTTNGLGAVCETPDEILFSLDAGDGEKIPRFVDAAILCRELGLLANIEIKPACGFEAQTAVAVSRLAADIWWNAAVQPLISSFSLDVIQIARTQTPQIRCGLLFEEVPAQWLTEFRRLQAFSLHCDASCLSDLVLAEVIAEKIPLLCYTVNEPLQASNLFERGVSAIFTDRLDLFGNETSSYKSSHLVG